MESSRAKLLCYENANSLFIVEPSSLRHWEHLLKSENVLSNSQMDVGENTRFALSNLSTEQRKVAFTGMKQLYVETTKYLIAHFNR